LIFTPSDPTIFFYLFSFFMLFVSFVDKEHPILVLIFCLLLYSAVPGMARAAVAGAGVIHR
jgi:hypothetical protein